MNALETEYDQYYLTSRDAWTSPQRDGLACAIVRQYLTPKTILDVGCGNGHTLEAMRTAFPGASLYGVDVSGQAVRIAQARLPRAIFTKSLISDYAPDTVFDLVLVMGTAEHFEDLDAGLKRLRELTADICYLEVPNNLVYSPGQHEYRRLETGSRQMEWHLDRQEWERRIKRAGFTISQAYTGPSPVFEFIWTLC